MTTTISRIGIATAAAIAIAIATSKPAAAQDEEETGAGRVSVAIFVLVDGKIPAALHAALVRALERGLKANDKIVVKETDLLLARFAGEVPEDQIGEARALAAGGTELFGRGNFDGAVKKLESAELALEAVLAFVKKNELAEAQFLLGASYLATNDKASAQEAFERLLAWRPTYVVDVDRHPKALPVFEKAREALATRGRGSIEVKTEPTGTQVFVDGKYVGVSPARIEALTVGDHYVTLKKDGYRRRMVKVPVDSKVEQTIVEKLEQSEKYLLLSQSLEHARPELGNKDAPDAILDLRTFLFIDQAIFLVAKADKTGLTVDAYLYDLRSKRRLSAVKNARVTGKETKLAELATALYTGVRYDGKTEADDRLARAARGGGKKRSGGVTSKWWFWTIIGVGVGAGIPLVLLSTGAFDSEAGAPCPDNQVCGQVLIRY